MEQEQPTTRVASRREIVGVVEDPRQDESSSARQDQGIRGLGVAAAIVGAVLLVVGLWAFVGPSTATERKDFVQAVGVLLAGLVGLVGLLFTWRSQRITQTNLERTQEKTEEQLRLTREGQITERFTQAIDQLGSEKLEIRLGAIYALERIARDSDRDHWPIMEILTAYVRQHAPWQPGEGHSEQDVTEEEHEGDPGEKINPTDPSDPDPDIQAIMTVLRRRTRYYGDGELEPIDLSETDLALVNLFDVNLQGANLRPANLRLANLQRAHLQGVHLGQANLQGADLQGADLREAYLQVADLQGANLQGANLWGADLHAANLQGANLFEANLQGADLREANLWGAGLVRVNLSGANLREANLRGADLTREQLEEALGDENTHLPDHLKRPTNWVRSPGEQAEGG